MYRRVGGENGSQDNLVRVFVRFFLTKAGYLKHLMEGDDRNFKVMRQMPSLPSRRPWRSTWLVLTKTSIHAPSMASTSPSCQRTFSMSVAFVESGGMVRKIINSESKRRGGRNVTRDNQFDIWREG